MKEHEAQSDERAKLMESLHPELPRRPFAKALRSAERRRAGGMRSPYLSLGGAHGYQRI